MPPMPAASKNSEKEKKPHHINDIMDSQRLATLLKKAKILSQLNQVCQQILPDNIKKMIKIMNVDSKRVSFAAQNASVATFTLTFEKKLMAAVIKHHPYYQPTAFRIKIKPELFLS